MNEQTRCKPLIHPKDHIDADVLRVSGRNSSVLGRLWPTLFSAHDGRLHPSDQTRCSHHIMMDCVLSADGRAITLRLRHIMIARPSCCA